MHPPPEPHPQAKLVPPGSTVAGPEGCRRGLPVEERGRPGRGQLGGAQRHRHAIAAHRRDHAGGVSHHADVAGERRLRGEGYLGDGAETV